MGAECEHCPRVDVESMRLLTLLQKMHDSMTKEKLEMNRRQFICHDLLSKHRFGIFKQPLKLALGKRRFCNFLHVFPSCTATATQRQSF